MTLFNKTKGLFILLATGFLLSAIVAVSTELYFLVAFPFIALLLCAGWQYKNFIFYLLLFSLPFSFEYNFSPSLGTDLPDELLMLLTSFVFMSAWIYSPKLVTKETLQHPLLIVLFILLSWTMVTVLFSTEHLLSFKFLLAKSWYLGAFVLVPLIMFKTKDAITKAVVLLTIALFVVTTLILVRHSKYGFSFASINDAVVPFFRNHVNYSAMQVCLLPVLIAFWKLSKRKNARLYITVAIAILIAGIFFSYARGAWLALAAGMASYWLIKKRLLVIAYVTFIIITVAGIFWLKENDRYLQYAHDYETTIFHTNFNEHFIATYTLKDVSTAERFYRWIAGVRMLKDGGLTGYGPGTFYDNYKSYTVPAYKTWVSHNPEHSTAHNYFLLTAIEQGLPGLFFWLLLTGAILYYAQRLYHRVSDIYYKTVAITAGVILTMIMILNLLSDLIETDKIGSLFYLCLALLIATDVNTRKRSELSPDVESIP